MTWASRVPATLEALVATWRLVPDLAEGVLDGPLPVQIPDLEALSVGHDGSDEGASTVGDVSPEGYGTRPDREQFTVNCLIAVLNGAGDAKAARDRAFGMLSLAADAVAEDVTLGGVVMRAHVQDMALSQQQTDMGALARVLFTVACDAYTAR